LRNGALVRDGDKLYLTSSGNLAVERLALARPKERTRILEDAIQAHRNALMVQSHATDPEAWATIQVNLAGSLAERAEFSKSPQRTELLEEASGAYRAALEAYAGSGDAERWLLAHNGLTKVTVAQEITAESKKAPVGIFVSHSHEDNLFTMKLVADLDKGGAVVWVDIVNSRPGDIVHEIDSALETCDWLVVVLTPASLLSKAVQTEVNAALNLLWQERMRGIIPVIAAQVDRTKVPATWAIQKSFDATADYNDALKRLLMAVDLLPTVKKARRRLATEKKEVRSGPRRLPQRSPSS
jgi:hypothetical protein